MPSPRRWWIRLGEHLSKSPWAKLALLLSGIAALVAIHHGPWAVLLAGILAIVGLWGESIFPWMFAVGVAGVLADLLASI